MNRRCHVQASLMIFGMIIFCHGKNWMYSKSWIEDYRTSVKYGLPYQLAPTEYSLETHKIGVIQREEDRYLDEGSYDFRESSTVFGKMRNLAVRNKGETYVGQLMSDEIIVPKNVTHALPSLRVDMILLERANDETVNFIGILESPENDSYSTFSSSLRNSRKNSSVSYEFVLCGNYRRNDMRSVGYMDIHYDTDSDLHNSIAQEAVVVDPYLFVVAVKSLVVNGISVATCEQLNVQKAIFDNTVPGIYLPFMIFRRFMDTINDYAIEKDIPDEMKIWERRNHVCFEGPVDWKLIPGMRVEFFSRENGAIAVLYSGESLVQRYYTKNSEKTTFCYIFAIRKSDDERVVFGRSAFEGLRLIFNRTRRAISFLENPRSATNLNTNLDTYWIWIMIAAIVVAILACLFSIPKSVNRGFCGPPTIHIFVPENVASKCERNCQERSTETTE